MSHGISLDETIVTRFGLADNLLTLVGPVQNVLHPTLSEPMFLFRVEEVPEVIHLERSYVFDNQVSLKPSYGKGDKILAWMSRLRRTPANQPGAATLDLLMARDLFLLNDWREFQRFKQFVKSMKILDAQARQWLTDHHEEFAQLAQSDNGMRRILECLAHVAEWPDLDGVGDDRHLSSLELIAKTYSPSLAPVRSAARMPGQLLAMSPDKRFNIFRLMSFVEDSVHGSRSLIRFLADLAAATGDPQVAEACNVLRSGRDLARAFAAVRRYLIAPPPGT